MAKTQSFSSTCSCSHLLGSNGHPRASSPGRVPRERPPAESKSKPDESGALTELKDLLKKYRTEGLVRVQLRTENLLTVHGHRICFGGSFASFRPEATAGVGKAQRSWSSTTPISGRKAALSLATRRKIQVSKDHTHGVGEVLGRVSHFVPRGKGAEPVRFSEARKEGYLAGVQVKTQKQDLRFESVELEIEPNTQSIRTISYVDETENQVAYVFGVTKYKVKTSSGSFRYKPPKGAEVSEFN